MKLFKNYFMITADADLNSTLPVIGLNGEKLKLDKQFNPYHHSTQIGQIAEVPDTFSESSIDSHTLKKGDTVWFHHFVCQPKNLWLIKGEEFYQAKWELIWAKVEAGNLIPINQWIFVEPISEEEEDMYYGGIQLHDVRENLQQVGTAFAVSAHAQKMGVNVGDRVHFIKDADYEIEIDDKKLWRMKLPTIVAVERDGKLYPLSDKILIKENERDDRVIRFGLLLPLSEQPKQRYGIVLASGENAKVANDGDEVCFIHGVYTNFYYKNEEYAIIRKENLISKT